MSRRDDVFADALDGARARPRKGLAWSGGIERRWQARSVMRADLDPMGWELAVHPMRDLHALAPAVGELEARAVAPNVTFSRAVLEAQYPRLAREAHRGNVRLACLWRTDALSDERSLVAAMPIATPRLGWPRSPAIRVASNEHLPLGTPLLDREEPQAAARLLEMLGDPALGLPATVVFADLPLDGAAARAIAEAAGTAIVVRERHRAVLEPASGIGLASKRARDLRRQRRNLDALGTVTHEIAQHGAALADALEAFVALELRSWKGRRGTSLYSVRHVGAFARDAVHRLAEEGRASVHLLRLDGQPIAGLVVIGGREQRITWKVAHDPAFAVHSPGVQVLREASQGWLADGTAHVDSIAEADHPVMDRLWAGRMRVGDLVCSLRGPMADAERVADAVSRRDRVREVAKGLVRHLGGRGSPLRERLKI